MKPIRILIVDDHTLFRSGIKLVLQRHEGFEVVGEAGDGLEGVKRAKQLNPDVVLLDLHMAGTGGLEALRLLVEDVPEAQVIMLTVSENAEDLLETLRAGARGYLLKNIDTEFLLESIRRAARGESVMSPQIAHKLADSLRAPPRDTAAAVADINPSKLSPREREIIVMLARGASNKEIARQLELSESTIKIHVQGILRKLNIAKRVQAAVYASEHGLI
ncbi:MAG: Nitrate/nitrite response regulator protein [Gallionellaceae bacterium]|nr:MAG: Nitrate/nitrite response regulator protein [Gallionellaceae bacterium]